MVHLTGFFGGVLDWVLALGVGVAAWGEAGDWSAAVGTALARPGKVIVLAGAAGLMVLGGALTRARGALPMEPGAPSSRASSAWRWCPCWSAPAPWVVLSGILIRIAVACVGATLAGAIGVSEEGA